MTILSKDTIFYFILLFSCNVIIQLITIARLYSENKLEWANLTSATVIILVNAYLCRAYYKDLKERNIKIIEAQKNAELKEKQSVNVWVDFEREVLS